MKREIFKRLIFVGILMAILIIVLSSCFKVDANTYNKYVIDIKGETSTNSNNEFEITRNIIKAQSTDRSVMLETSVKNVRSITQYQDIAILIDTSYSMDVNSNLAQVKAKAIDFVQQLYTLAGGTTARVSVYTTGAAVSSSKVSLNSYADFTTIQNYINSIAQNGSGYSLDEGIKRITTAAASNGFEYGNANVTKYMMIFTDATDDAEGTMQQETDNNDTQFIMVSTGGISNTKYGTRDNPALYLRGVYDIASMNCEEISQDIKGTIINFSVEDIFSDLVRECFTFEPQSIILGDNTSVDIAKVALNSTATGYKWNIDKLSSQQTIKLKWKVTLKEDSVVSEKAMQLNKQTVIYNEIETNKKATISYSVMSGNETLELTTSPKIMLCETYSLSVQAVDVNDSSKNISGVQFQVTGTNQVTGEAVYSGTETSGSDGKITIGGIKTTDPVVFTVTPSIQTIGYESPEAREFVVTNTYHTSDGPRLMVQGDPDLKYTVDNASRNVLITVPVSPQGFDFEIQLTDTDGTSPLINAEFKLAAPKVNSHTEMDVLTGKTDSNGYFCFRPNVMTQDGEYMFFLTQLSTELGYSPVGNVTVYVSFQSGVVKSITTYYNDKVVGTKISGDKVRLTITNQSDNVDEFNFKLHVSDSADSTIPVKNAVYSIQLRRAIDGQTKNYGAFQTNESGDIDLKISGTGLLELVITETEPNGAYVADTKVKLVQFTRQAGILTSGSYSAGCNVDVSTVDLIKVSLQSKKKSEQNVFRVKLVDGSDECAEMPDLIGVKLTNTTTGAVYEEEYTMDGLGYVDVYLPTNLQSGGYEFLISIDPTTVPAWYGVPVTSRVRVDIGLDGFIQDAHELSGAVRSTVVSTESENLMLKHVATAEVVFLLEDTNNNRLTIKTGGAIDKELVAGAKYDIVIQFGASYTLERVIKGRVTDDNGYISTILPTSEEYYITVTQTAVPNGYKLDPIPQEFTLTTVGANISHSDGMWQTPRTGDEVNFGSGGTIIGGTELHYDHFIQPITAEDTFFDMDIYKLTTDDMPVQGQHIYVKSEMITVDGVEKGIVNRLTGETLKETLGPTDNNGEIYTPEVNPDDNGPRYRVKGMKINEEETFTLYLYEFQDGTSLDAMMGLNGEDPENYLDTSSEVKVRVTFRYNENKEIIQVTNFSIVKGNRFVKEKSLDGSLTYNGYESLVRLWVYSDFDSVGNFAIDFTKKNIDGTQVLNGAKYDIVITKPNGVTFIKKDQLITDTTAGYGYEIPGVLLAAGTTIEITEVESPIGYDKSPESELITITAVDETTGQIEYSVSPSALTKQRMKITGTNIVTNSDGTLKTELYADLYDAEENTFNVGIKATDKTTNNPVAGFQFKVVTTSLAESITPATAEDGTTTTKVGAQYKDTKVQYTITTTNVPEFYKGITTPIVVEVEFDSNGKPVGYTDISGDELTRWKMLKLPTDENGMDIQIFVEKQDPLEVKITTIDNVTGNKVANVGYTISPSEDISGISVPNTTDNTAEVKVGYAKLGGITEYKVVQDPITSFKYETLGDVFFQVNYDSATADVNNAIAISPAISKITWTGKKVDIELRVEPLQGINISNKDFFSGLTIYGAQFKVSKVDGSTLTERSTGTVQPNGSAILYGEQLGKNTTVRYRVEQTSGATSVSVGKYATVENFDIEVVYNDSREVVSANIIGGNTNWYSASVTRPSYSYALGYNGNEKGIVNIEIKSYPAMRFDITVKDQLNNANPVGDSSYSITSTIPTASGTETTALSTGKTTAYIDRTLRSGYTTYTVDEVKANNDYQAILSDIQVFVQFDSNGYISSVTAVTAGDWYTVKADTGTPADPTTYFRVFLDIKSIPKFRLNLVNQDRVSGLPIEGVKYCSDSSINNTPDATTGVYTNTLGQELEVGTTNNQGKTSVRIIKSNKDTTMQFTVKEISTVSGYQELEKDVIIEVVFNANGTVKTTKVVQGDAYAVATVIASPANTFEQMTVNLVIKNYKVMDVELTTVAEGTTVPIQYIKYSAEAKLKDTGEILWTPNNEETDASGKALFRFKKALSNKTVVYTFKQLTKAPGFEWIPSEIALEVEYGADGKIYAIVDASGNRIQVVDASGNVISVQGVKIATGTTFTSVAKIDIDGFKINLTVQDSEIKEFNMSLNVVDKYDQTKFLEKGNYNAYLSDKNSSSRAAIDEKYHVNLISGRDDDNDGIADTGHGKDEQVFGQYISDSPTGETRYLVVRQTGYTDKDGVYQNGTPTRYYKNDKMINSSYASQESYSILIAVQFDYEGKIVSATNVATGPESIDYTLSYLLDSRYVTITHTKYNVNVTLNYYPLVEFQVVTENAFDGNEYLDATYEISTRAMTPYAAVPESEFIKSGYVGHYQTYGYYGSSIYGQYLNTLTYNSKAADGENQTTSTSDIVKIEETGKSRTFYVYANYGKGQIPANFQRYSDWYPYYYRDHLLGTVTVTYDDLGEIKSTTWTEDGLTKNISNHNIPESMNVDISSNENRRVLKLTVKYAPTTSVQVQAIDNVTGSGLSGIRIAPFNTATPGHTERRWEYYTGVGYFDTAASGYTSKWQYSGANRAGETQYVRLETSFGSSGSAYARYYSAGTVNIEVTYGANGKISKAVVVSTDQFGDPNATVTTDGTTLHVVVIENRKFVANIGKTDAYSKVDQVGSKFTIYREKFLEPWAEGISLPTKNFELGKIEPGKTVKYTFVEDQAPFEYLKRETFAVWVTFNLDGTVQNIETSPDISGKTKNTYIWDSTNTYHTSPSTISDKDSLIIPHFIAAKNTGRVSATNIDLAFSITDIKLFKINIELQDKYYTDEKLSGGLFEVYNTVDGVKKDSANGTIVTDSNGKVTAFVGEVYPGKSVTYTIKQKSIIAGYYENTETAEITVTFDNSGMIQSYTTNGVGLMRVDTTKFVGKQYVDLTVNNVPKDVRIGLYKFDETTKAPIANAEFTVYRYDSNDQLLDYQVLKTDTDGTAMKVVDEFLGTENGRTIKYVVKETVKPNSYRAINDLEFYISYDQEGRIQFANTGGTGLVSIPISGSLKQVGTYKVQIAVNAPNDNSYDIIVKDEDTDKAGLGIEGTKYDLAVNNITQTQLETDTNGIASSDKRTETGKIKVEVSENTIGEGYEGNTANKLTFMIDKGVVEYSLKLDTTDFNSRYNVLNVSYPGVANEIVEYEVELKNAAGTVTGTAKLRIDENLGDISVTFKNASRFEITVYNSDINTEELLQGAQFGIDIVKCSDLLGTEIAGTSTTITTPYNDTIGSSKLLYFDLGITHYSEVLKFKFVQKTAPTGYNKIYDQYFIVQFNQYGRVESITPGGYRIDADVVGNSHSLIANLKNGTEAPKFTVKVVKSDSETNNRLNDVEFNLGVKNIDTSNVLLDETKIVTANRVDKNSGRVLEKGVVYTDVPVTSTTDGNISISLDETKGSLGYDPKATVTSGEIKIDAQITPIDDYEDTVALKVVDNAGFDVTVDSANRLVTVKVLNQPAITLNIVKEDFDLINPDDPNSESTKIPGVKFKVTSIIQGRTSVQKTTLDVTTDATNAEGKSSSSIGKPYAGQSVIYTLEEEKLEGYDQLDPVQVLVMFDTKGFVKYAEVLSDTSATTIIDLRHDKDGAEEEGSIIGSRDLSLNIKNTKSTSSDDKYKIILNKRYRDDLISDSPLQGAKYELRIEQEFGGISTWTWDGVTDEDGKIYSPTFDGYGEVKIYVQELTPPEGFLIDNRTYLYIFNKDRTTGEIEVVTQDGESDPVTEDVNGVSEINLIQRNVQESSKFNVAVIKSDSSTGYAITESQAQFQVTRISKVTEDGTIGTEIPADETTGGTGDTGEVGTLATETEVVDELKYANTNEVGQAQFLGLAIPDAGTYIYRIKELKAPDGYYIQENELEFEVTFAKAEDDSYIITSVNSHALPDLQVLTFKGRTVVLKFADLSEIDGTTFYLDVTKVDSETKLPITDMAVFKVTLPDEIPTDTDTGTGNTTNTTTNTTVSTSATNTSNTTNSTNTTGETTPKTSTGNSAYAETNEEGKLQFFYIGADAADKIDLARLPRPTKPCTLRYTIKEVAAPEGYAGYYQDIYVDVVFVKNEQEQIVIDQDASKVTTEDSSMVAINTSSVTSRKFSIDVLNTKAANISKYTVRLDLHDGEDFDGALLPGAKYDIKIYQEYGLNLWQNVDTTDAEGKIYVPTFDGYGDIRIEITMVAAPEGYKLDSRTYTYKYNRERLTGVIDLYSQDNASGEMEEDASGNNILVLTPTATLSDNLYNITIMKTDSVTGTSICDPTTVIQLTRYNKYTGTDGTESLVQVETWTENVDASGRLSKRGLPIPASGGTYTYGIKEVKAPEGYVIDTEERYIDVTFSTNEFGVLYVSNVVSKSEPNVKITKSTNKTIIASFNNSSKGIYWLDITKVDGSTYDSTKDSYTPLTKMAVFKITSGTTANLYSESSTTNGKLEYYYSDITLDKTDLRALKVPKEPSEVVYTIKEAIAPEGYNIYKGEIKLTIKFDDLDKDGYMEIASYTITTEDMSYIHENTSQNTDRKISFDILNKEGEPLYINSSKYLFTADKPTTAYTIGTYNEYKEGDAFIAGFSPRNTLALTETENTVGTTIQSVLDGTSIVTNADTIEFYDPDGTKVIDNTQLVKTGMTIKFIKGTESVSLIAAVRGDVTGDGCIQVRDKQWVSTFFVNGFVYNTNMKSKVQEIAADVDLTGEINLRDITRITRAIVNWDTRELTK